MRVRLPMPPMINVRVNWGGMGSGTPMPVSSFHSALICFDRLLSHPRPGEARFDQVSAGLAHLLREWRIVDDLQNRLSDLLRIKIHYKSRFHLSHLGEMTIF